MQNQEFVTDTLVEETQPEVESTEQAQDLDENLTNGFFQEPTEEEPAKELSEVEKLTKRRTGFWAVNLEPADLKWIKNACQNKFEFTGPNEAFMLMNCYLGFAAAVARHEEAVKQKMEEQPAVVQASAIEACALLINRFSAAGIESAQRIFRIAISLNTIIMEMQSLDKQIAELKAASTESELSNESAEQDGIQ